MNRAERRRQQRATRRRSDPPPQIQRVPCETIPAFYELWQPSWGTPDQETSTGRRR